MGDGGKGDDKDGSNSAGAVNNIQGGGSNGDTSRERELGSYGGNDEGDGRVPPLVGPEYSRDVNSTIWGGEMGVVIGGIVLGSGGAVDNDRVYSEAEG